MFVYLFIYIYKEAQLHYLNLLGAFKVCAVVVSFVTKHENNYFLVQDEVMISFGTVYFRFKRMQIIVH